MHIASVCHGLRLVLVAWLATPLLHAQAVSRPALARTVDSLATGAIADGPVAGISIAVVKGRDTLVMKGYGLADVENELPVSGATVFRIGSITKQFTASAVMQLVQEGRIGLDDEITKYLPGYPVQGHKVLIRHLLNHTSGIKSYTGLGRPWSSKMRLDLPHDSSTPHFSTWGSHMRPAPSVPPSAIWCGGRARSMTGGW